MSRNEDIETSPHKDGLLFFVTVSPTQGAVDGCEEDAEDDYKYFFHVFSCALNDILSLCLAYWAVSG